jgi:D-serine dehydratase
MGYELAEQLDWTLPDWIIYPTGGGTGLIGMWKAFAEMEAIGWLAPGHRPRMVSVQAEGCAPIIRAYTKGAETADTWEGAHTVADGLRVPRAFADFLILRTIRESGGTAVSVGDEQMVDDMKVMGREEGISAAPEGAASLSAVRQLVADGTIKKHEDRRPLQHRRRAEVSRPDSLITQSPSDTPIARAVLIKSESSGTVLVRPTTSASGIGTMSGGLFATIFPNTPR